MGASMNRTTSTRTSRDRPTELSRLIDVRVRDLDLSSRQVSERSNGDISPAAVANYRRGIHPATPTDRILRALSLALGIPLRQLQRAAGVKESVGEWAPPPEAHQLDRKQRRVVEAMIKMLVAVPDAKPEKAA